MEDDGTLMCSYHGWRFNDCGKCVKIPQADDQRSHEAACNSPRSAVMTFPCKVPIGFERYVSRILDVLLQDHGTILWLWPDASGDASEEAANTSPVMSDRLAKYFEHQASTGRRSGCARVVPYAFEVLFENLLDPSHVPFLHHSVSRGVRRSSAKPLLMTVASPSSPLSTMAVECSSGLLVGQYSRLEMLGRCAVEYQSTTQDAEVSHGVLLFLMSPMADNRSQLLIDSIPDGALSGHATKTSFWRSLMYRFPFLLHFYRNEMFDGDNFVLHLQDVSIRERTEETSPKNLFHTPTSADRPTTEFRRWFNTEGGGGPFGRSKKRIAPLSRREILDRYKSHTLQCKECLKALSAIHLLVHVLRFLSRGCLLLAGVAAIRGPQWGVLDRRLCSLSLAACALFFFLERYLQTRILPLFHFVDYVHAERN